MSLVYQFFTIFQHIPLALITLEKYDHYMHVQQQISVLIAAFIAAIASLFSPQKIVVHPAPLSPVPSITLSPTVTIVSPSSPSSTVSAFIYPHATQTASQEQEIRLSSTDSPQQITQWYKDQFQNQEMHTTSDSESNTNDTILNVLEGSSNTMEVRIVIQKVAGDTQTDIRVRQVYK